MLYHFRYNMWYLYSYWFESNSKLAYSSAKIKFFAKNRCIALTSNLHLGSQFDRNDLNTPTGMQQRGVNVALVATSFSQKQTHRN